MNANEDKTRYRSLFEKAGNYIWGTVASVAFLAALATLGHALLSIKDDFTGGTYELQANLKEFQGEVREELQTLQTSVDNNTKAITALDGRMDSLDGRMDSLDGRMDSLDGRMDSLEGKIDSIHEKLDALIAISPGTGTRNTDMLAPDRDTEDLRGPGFQRKPRASAASVRRHP